LARARAWARLLAALCCGALCLCVSLFASLVASCGAPRAFTAEPGAYDRVPEAWGESLFAARLAFERGEMHVAHGLVAPLCLDVPRLLPVRVFLQEIELALLSSEGRLGELTASTAPEARAVLARRYEERAEVEPRAEGYVLAARLAADGEEALALLAEADTIDSRCVWVHYGRAWWYYQLRDFKKARESLRTALRLDGGHLPSLRLHATLLAGAGEGDEAAAALEVWLARTAEDPLFSAAERADALLDLAALEVLADEPKAALELLEELDPRAVRDPVRAEEVRAAAHDARGELTQALEAVRRARAQRPDVLLPIVQQALLLQSAGDVEGERRTWQHLLDLTAARAAVAGEEDLASIDFEAALFRLQAHTRLARLAQASAPVSP
jgi:tetratricopeptide (TPR) repeat protein